jgi:hypothetical protein
MQLRSPAYFQGEVVRNQIMELLEKKRGKAAARERANGKGK